MNKKQRRIKNIDFTGQYLVFTGKLKITRKEATALLKKMGCHVQSPVTRKTTVLVLGNQQQKRMRQGHHRSLKHDAVRKRIKEGQDITILSQETFYDLINSPCQLSLLDLVGRSTPQKAPLEQKTAFKQRSTRKSPNHPESVMPFRQGSVPIP